MCMHQRTVHDGRGSDVDCVNMKINADEGPWGKEARDRG